MARARNIKPGFFRNAELVELPIETRLLFPGLWILADREGRLEDRPKQIKMEIFPADNFDIDSMLNQLSDAGLIERYEVDGKRYIQVTNFAKHQNPHRDERASLIPAPNKHCANTVQTLCEIDADSVAIGLNPDVLNPDVLNPESNTLEASPQDEDSEFNLAWDLYPKRPGASKKSTFKAWTARIKAGVKPESMLSGVKSYAAYCLAMRTEPNYIKTPETFFGPNEHYKSDWTPVQPQASPAQRKPKPDNFENRVYVGGRL